MKKALVMLCIFTLVLSVCFANGAAETNENVKEDKIVLEYMSGTILEGAEGKFERAVVDQFNAEHPDIEIKPIGVPANQQLKKYIALATVGDMPDFFLVQDAVASTIIDLEIAQPLNDLCPEILDEYYPAYLDMFSDSEGNHFGLPWFAAPSGILYRKDIFDANNIEAPTTWDEMVEACQALTKDGNYGMTIVGTKNGSGASRFRHVARNYGVDEFYQDENGKWCTDIGSENYTRALRDFTDLDLKYHVVPSGIVETGYPDAVSLFSSGKAAMLITGSNAIGAITSQVPELKGKLGSFPVPAVERFVAAPSGSAFFINKDCAHPEAVLEFLAFLMNTENSTTFGELTGRLVPKKAYGPEDYTDPALPGFLKALDADYTQPAIPGYGETNDIHGEAYQNVFTGAMTPEEASANAGARAQKVCDAANAK